MRETAQTTARAELAARWLQWAAGSSVFASPLLDRTGRAAGRGQPQDVWFLAGVRGGAAHRTFEVPSGRHLFCPAFSVWNSRPIALPGKAFGPVRVDGEAVRTMPIATDAVLVRGAALNPVTGSALPRRRYVAGIWAEIAALSGGNHSVVIRGRDGRRRELAVYATIHVS